LADAMVPVGGAALGGPGGGVISDPAGEAAGVAAGDISPGDIDASAGRGSGLAPGRPSDRANGERKGVRADGGDAGRTTDAALDR
jgi:hypothetical protein